MTTPKNKRLPKARVANAWRDRYIDRSEMPCAVIPAPTAQQARQIVKAAPFLTMTDEEQVERIALILSPDSPFSAKTYANARAVLAAIHGGAR